MKTFLMKAKLCYNKQVIVLVILYSVLSRADSKCVQTCINGNCDNLDKCVCDPCFVGANCDQFVDSFDPKFDTNSKKILINTRHLSEDRPIFVAKAYDEDSSVSCKGRKNCLCSEINYQLEDSQSYDGLFKINAKNGGLFVTDLHKIVLDKKYNIVILAKPAHENHNFTPSQLQLTIIFENELHRVRRSSDPSPDERISKQITNFQTTFNLNILDGEPNELVTGDTIQYRLDVSLPKTSGMDLVIELYTKDILNVSYSPALTLYNITIPSSIPGIRFIQSGVPPKPQMILNSIINNVCDHVLLDFGSISNSAFDGNKLAIFFSVAMIRNPQIAVGSKQFVTIGTEYNHGSFVWVGQSQLTAATLSPKEDLQFAEVEIQGPESILLDSNAIFTVTSYLEFRSDPVILEISGPSHLYEPDNVLAMGQIGITHFGTSYQTIPNTPQHYKAMRFDSQSQMSFVKSALDMGLVTNVGQKTGKPTNDAGNKLVFSFSIYATNYQENVGKSAPVDVKLKVGNNTVWSKSVTVKVQPRKNEQYFLKLLNAIGNYTAENASAGGMTSAIIEGEMLEADSFTEVSVQVEVPVSRKIHLLIPCTGKLLKEKSGFNIPYVDEKLIEPIVDGNLYKFNFGRIQMIKQRNVKSKKYENTFAIEIFFKIAFHEENSFDGKTLSPSIKLIAGDNSLAVKTGEIKIVTDKKLIPPQFNVKKSVSWDELYVDGGIGIDLEMTLPIGVSYEGIKIEVHGDNDSKTVLPEINVCRFEVYKIGNAMPCSCVSVDTINQKSVVYEQSYNSNTTGRDQAILNFGDVSVLQNQIDEIERKIKFNFVASMLTGIPFKDDQNYPFLIGVSFDSKPIWSSKISFPMKNGFSKNLIEEQKPYLKVKLESNKDVFPGFTKNIEILLKISPNTISTYSLEAFTNDNEVSICGLWIDHVGRNMPCVDENKKAVYEKRKFGENNKAIMDFNIIANTGPTLLLSPAEEDYANTIKLIAMVKVKSTAKNNKIINIIANYGQSGNKLQHQVHLQLNFERTKSEMVFPMPKSFTFNTFNSDEAKIGSLMLLNFDIELEKNSQSVIKSKISKSKEYEICDAAILTVGQNYPCYSPFEFSKDLSNGTFDFGLVCNTYLNHENANENKFRMATAIRFNDKLQEGKKIKISGNGFVGDKQIGKQQEINLVTTKEIEQKLAENAKAILKPKGSLPIFAKIRENVWVPFNLTLPPHSTVRISVEGQGVTEDNKAVITVHGLRIKSGGANIPCPLANANPEVTFKSSIDNQNDVVQADLGYFSNFGFTYSFGNALPGDDDITIEILAQLADHIITDENSEHNVKMTVTLGSDTQKQTVSAVKNLKVQRTGAERPILESEIEIPGQDIVYDRNQVIEAKVMIRHNENSRGEPLDSALRLFLPKFLTFGQIVSANTKELPIVKNTTEGSSVDIKLQSISFSDQITLNFTLIVDPSNKLGYGSNVTTNSIPYRMICEHQRVINLPFPCSKINDFVIKSVSSECNNPLGMEDGRIKDCQITASSAVNNDYSPYLARLNTNGYWIPALRFWDQQQYLQVDFLTKTRVSKIGIQSLKGARKVTAFTLMSSDNGMTWDTVVSSAYFSYSDNDQAESSIPHPHEARFFRFVIEEASDAVKENDLYVAVRLEFYGCYIDSQDTSVECNMKDDTLYSNDDTRLNRHFIADKTSIYFCDSTSDMNKQVCYFSNSGGSSWNVLGRSLDSIEGVDTSKGEFYLVDNDKSAYLKTKDGVLWSPVTIDQLNQTTSSKNFVRRTNVPALHKTGLKHMSLKSGSWKAFQDGLYFEDHNIPKAIWRKCCRG